MAHQLSVLVVIPDEGVRVAVTDALEDVTDHLIRSCADVSAAESALRRVAPDVIVIDARLAALRVGRSLLMEACSGRPGLPVLRLRDGVAEDKVASREHPTFDPDDFLDSFESLVAVRGRTESRSTAASPPDPVEAVEGAPVTILVIDDDVIIRDLLVTLVSGPGRLVVTAADGPAGLSAVRQYEPDLVILDQMMPRMTGMQVLEQLRADGNNVPVVILSAHGTAVLTSRGWSAGMSQFLDKPFDVHTLSGCIDRLIQTQVAALGQ